MHQHRLAAGRKAVGRQCRRRCPSATSWGGRLPPAGLAQGRVAVVVALKAQPPAGQRLGLALALALAGVGWRARARARARVWAR
jgi:hypothetical protein